MNWIPFENFIGEEIPRCVKSVLNLCGYTTVFSLVEISEIHVKEMELHMNMKRIAIHWQCNHSDYYENLEEFEFLPGHMTIILALPKYASAYQQTLRTTFLEPNASFSFILNELIRTAEVNEHKDANHASYPKTVRFFSTYIFLLCGRACYEMLRANLPLPSTKTIRK